MDHEPAAIGSLAGDGSAGPGLVPQRYRGAPGGEDGGDEGTAPVVLKGQLPWY